MPESDMNEPIVVTGTGIISALGNCVAESMDALSRADVIPCAPDLPGCTIQKPVFKVRGFHGGHEDESRTMQLARHAFREAVEQAGLSGGSLSRAGICAGTTVASQLNDIEFYSDFRNGRGRSYDAVRRYLSGNIAEKLKADYGFSGPAVTVVNACSSATDAVGVATDWLCSGQCDAVVAGGADELNRVPIAGFNALGILSGSPCKPFDADRNGLNLGEGAGFLVLETASSARKRGAEVIAECSAYATASDAYHLTAPRPDGSGLETAIKKALDRAGATAGQMGFVNTHGTGTRTNDLVEGRMLKKLFGPDADIWATKGHTGHTLGAAGGIEAVLTVAALGEQRLFKSAGFENFDEEIGISPVRKEKQINAEYAMSASLAFGGMNSVLIFRRWKS